MENDYVAKISNATPLGLVIINYELILDCIRSACDALANDIAEFEARITKSRDLLMLLMNSLDFNYDISKILLKEYIYINSLLVKAYFSRNAQPLDDASGRLSEMLDGWRALTALENALPVMENAQQLYAGLTYKNGEPVEYTPADENRGFKA